MGVDCVDRQKLLDRIGFDRRDRIYRGVVDEEGEAIDRGDEICAIAFERTEVVQMSMRGWIAKQIQRLPRPPQTVAQPLQRRRHQEPAKLSRMAPRSRSLGRQTPTAKLDKRRHRKRTIPTANALRAIDFVVMTRTHPIPTSVNTKWLLAARFSFSDGGG